MQKFYHAAEGLGRLACKEDDLRKTVIEGVSSALHVANSRGVFYIP